MSVSLTVMFDKSAAHDAFSYAVLALVTCVQFLYFTFDGIFCTWRQRTVT